MTRLETSADTEREWLVARAIAPKPIWIERYSPSQYGEVDFVMRIGRAMLALIELKCRANASERFPTIILAEKKRAAVLHASHMHGVTPLFVAAFSDGVIAAVDLRRTRDLAPVPFARTRRRATGLVGPHDEELVVQIPRQAMRAVAVLSPEDLERYNALLAPR